jgi:hypothetical protein
MMFHTTPQIKRSQTTSTSTSTTITTPPPPPQSLVQGAFTQMYAIQTWQTIDGCGKLRGWVMEKASPAGIHEDVVCDGSLLLWLHYCVLQTTYPT